jgi:hypothetical protein
VEEGERNRGEAEGERREGAVEERITIKCRMTEAQGQAPYSSQKSQCAAKACANTKRGCARGNLKYARRKRR